jgi:hypothetical protein
VAHICNPSCSEDRDLEDHDSKPAQANSWQDPISTTTKKKSQKRAGEVAQGVGPDFKRKHHIKKNN